MAAIILVIGSIFMTDPFSESSLHQWFESRCVVIYVGIDQQLPEPVVDLFLHPSGALQGELQFMDVDNLQKYVHASDTRERPWVIRLELISRKKTPPGVLDDCINKIRAAARKGYVRLYVAIKE